MGMTGGVCGVVLVFDVRPGWIAGRSGRARIVGRYCAGHDVPILIMPETRVRLASWVPRSVTLGGTSLVMA